MLAQVCQRPWQFEHIQQFTLGSRLLITPVAYKAFA